MSYLDAYVLPLSTDYDQDAYNRMNRMFGEFMKEHGALSYIEAVGDDLPRGERTDFYRAVTADDAETVAVAFIVWPDKAARDAAWAAMEEAPQFKDMKPEDMPFDGKRMFWGGFVPVYEMD